MEEKEKQHKTFLSLDAYRDDEANRDHFTDTRSKIINFLIALVLILSFIGFIVFPQILIPGTLLLSACLIGAQALAGFAILAAISKVLFTLYERGWEKTLRMMLFAPVDFFFTYPVTASLFIAGFLAIGILIILSGTGVVTVPFLTVFVANSLSLEIEEIIVGLLSDIAVVSVGAMLCYLPSFLKEQWETWMAKPVVLPIEDENTPKNIQQVSNTDIDIEMQNRRENILSKEDSLKKPTKEALLEEEEKLLRINFCNLL